jgi:hypothetical protein
MSLLPGLQLLFSLRPLILTYLENRVPDGAFWRQVKENIAENAIYSIRPFCLCLTPMRQSMNDESA